MPGHSLIGSVATLDSSSVTWPVKPGSMKPAVEWVSRPRRPSDDLPSSRPARSSGSETVSYVDPRTNSPGCRMNGSLARRLDQLGQVFLLLGRVDEPVPVVLEDPEVAVEAQVDARRLDHGGVVRVDADPAGLDLCTEITIAEEHARRYREAWLLCPGGPAGSRRERLTRV